jgi:hypothetical protein
LVRRGRFSEARAIYERLASEGDVNCQVFLGWLYYEGLGIAKDEARAFTFFRIAAEAGSSQGEFYCGRYTVKIGRHAEALSWFRRAASKGYGPALLWLGIMTVRGIGVEPNLGTGIEYLKRSAKTGNFLALRELSILMIQGRLGVLSIPVGFLLLSYSVLGGVCTAILKEDSNRLIG